MAVYVDDAAIMYRGKPRFHLIADSLAELHSFCKTVGINKCWFHNAKGHPHYDITGEHRESAIKAGARPIDTGELLLRAETGRKRLLRYIAEHADNPEMLARYTSMLPVTTSQAEQLDFFK
jgi:hypothetical protein